MAGAIPTATDGRYGARYDAPTGLYWLSVRAYDPTLGRFLSRDPLGRAPLFLTDNPYVYAGANPLSNVDPSGQRVMGASNSQARNIAAWASKSLMLSKHPCDPSCRKANAASIRQAWIRYYEGQKWGVIVTADKVRIALDFVFLGIDVALALSAGGWHGSTWSLM